MDLGPLATAFLAAVEEPPGDPTALRQAARALGESAADSFRDTGRALRRKAADLTSADWYGPASLAFDGRAALLAGDAEDNQRVCREAAGVLKKLAAEIEEAKKRAKKAADRALDSATALRSAEGALDRLSDQTDPDPQAKGRLETRAKDARGDLSSAKGDAAQAADDARRAARIARDMLVSLAEEVREPAELPAPPVPVSVPADSAASDDIAPLFQGSPRDVFKTPFLPGLSPGDIRRSQIEEDQVAAARKREDDDDGPSFGDIVHGGLDAAGFVPGLGAVPDLANAGIYALEGDGKNAAWSAGAAIPIGGDLAKGGKIAKEAAEHGSKKVAKEAAEEGVEKGAKQAGEEVLPRVTSRIDEDPRLLKEAEKAGRSHQRSIDGLTRQLQQGNYNPGTGSKRLFSDVYEARAKDGARVYFRNTGDGVEILAKSNKGNQGTVIRALRQRYE